MGFLAGLTVDPAAGLAQFKAELVRYLQLPFYRAMLEASGLQKEIAAFDHSGQVMDTLAAALGGVGAPKIGQSFVDAYRQAGVTLPAIRPITFPDAAWYRRTLEEASRW